MNSHIHSQEQQPLHHSVLGLTLLLGWILAFILSLNNLNQPPAYIKSYGFHFIIQLLINWKIFTLICLMLGFKISFRGYSGRSDISFFKQHLLYLLLSIPLSFINGIALAFIPIIGINMLLYAVRRLNQLSLLVIGLGLFTMACVIGVLVPIEVLNLPCFGRLAITSLLTDSIGTVLSVWAQPEQLMTYLYGASVMVLGLILGKNNWFIEYNFHYDKLLQLFRIGLFLVVLWLGLKYFAVYEFIKSTFVGHLFYNFDLFSLQIVIVYLYIFVLIYMENYKWGKLVHVFLGKLSMNWILQLVGIFTLLGLSRLSILQDISYPIYLLAAIVFFAIIYFIGWQLLKHKSIKQ